MTFRDVAFVVSFLCMAAGAFWLAGLAAAGVAVGAAGVLIALLGERP